MVFSLSYDGGEIDAGDDCFAACDGFSVDLSNVSACALVTLDGGGPGLSCRGEYTPTGGGGVVGGPLDRREFEEAMLGPARLETEEVAQVSPTYG